MAGQKLHREAGPGMPPDPVAEKRREAAERGESRERVMEAALEVARRVVGRFHARHGRLPLAPELTLATHMAEPMTGLKRLADPGLQEILPVLKGQADPEPAAHEAKIGKSGGKRPRSRKRTR